MLGDQQVYLKNTFLVYLDNLSCLYLPQILSLLVSAPLTSSIRFFYAGFVVSIVVYEEDFEDSNDTLTAPPVPREPTNKYFHNSYPNYNNT